MAHGCTGKGNDQVRFDLTVMPWRPTSRSSPPCGVAHDPRRGDRVRPAHGIPVPTTVKSPYSVDQNLWGRSLECGRPGGPLERAPPRTPTPGRSARPPPPTLPLYIEIDFEKGIPVALDGEP